jgi:hypothetical protein
MSKRQVPALLQVRVVDAQAWARWIRTVRTEIAELKETGDVHPDLAAPQAAHDGLVAVLEAIDALPANTDCADLPLPDSERLRALTAQMAHVRPMFDRWLEWGLLSAVPLEAADRFERQLHDRARELAPVETLAAGRQHSASG